MKLFNAALSTAIYLLLPLASAFVNPIKTLNGSDPQLIYHEGMYYLTSTTWFDVQITAASTIQGLKEATPKVVYSDRSDPARARNWWAPELWFVQGRWYIYFTTSVNGTWEVMIPSLRQWVLEGGTDTPLSDPFKLVGNIRPSNYKGGMLDGTVYNIDGQNYYVFSAVNGPESPNGASLWISKLLTPTSVGPATMIAYPALGWEKEDSAVLEGPAGITSPTGDIYLVYSADSCNTPAYKLGALKLKKQSDPLLPSSWSKLPEPLLVTDEQRGIFGPGHNGFFKSPDGTEDWIVFHANRNASGDCDGYRQTFIQPVEWSGDGALRLAPVVPPGTDIREP